jgi:hypothetical protein
VAFDDWMMTTLLEAAEAERYEPDDRPYPYAAPEERVLH